MTLREQQSLFIQLKAQFELWVFAQGWELTGKELLRTKLQADANAASGAGISNSLHLLGLAQDYALFKDGMNLTGLEDWRPLGEKWESMHPMARWGGRFGDADHFSLEWGGVK